MRSWWRLFCRKTASIMPPQMSPRGSRTPSVRRCIRSWLLLPQPGHQAEADGEFEAEDDVAPNDEAFRREDCLVKLDYQALQAHLEAVQRGSSRWVSSSPPQGVS